MGDGKTVGILGFGNTRRFVFPAGSQAPVSSPQRAAVRYNEVANQVEFSLAGAPYAPLGGGGAAPQYFVGPPGTNAPFTSISAAIAQGSADFPSDPFAVLVLPGTYTENVAITRGGIAIFGFANQSFETNLVGDLSFTPPAAPPVAQVAISNLNIIDGSFQFLGSNQGQLWIDNVSVETNSAASSWLMVNAGDNSLVAARNARGVNTSAGLALDIQMVGNLADCRFYGGNSLFRKTDRSQRSVFCLNGPNTFVSLAGPALEIDGFLQVDASGPFVLTDALVQTDGGAAPIVWNATGFAGGQPLGQIAKTALVQIGPPPAFAIDSTAAASAWLGYLDVQNRTGAPGLNAGFNPAQVVNLSGTLIP